MHIKCKCKRQIEGPVKTKLCEDQNMWREYLTVFKDLLQNQSPRGVLWKKVLLEISQFLKKTPVPESSLF